jgi:pimeloyl-ACP methyl ester carboxylesterase
MPSGLHLIDRGSGPAVIFQHGTFMDHTMFAPQVAAVAGAGSRAVSYDSRALVDPSSLHTLSDLAGDCLALADSLAIDRFVLCGMSVGAFMAIELALMRPDRLRGLILIDGKAAAYSREEREALVPRFEPLDVDGPVPEAFARWVAPLCFGRTTASNNPALVEHWVERWTTVIPARAVHRQYRSWIDRVDRRPRLTEITVPTLLIHGEEDVPTPLAHSLGMHSAIPGSRLVVIPGAGHTSNLEQPGIANEAMLDFLRRLPPA